MIFYLIPPILSLLSSLFYERFTVTSRNVLYYIIISLSVLIYPCVYVNGTDWTGYEPAYNNIDFSNISQYSWEIGFLYLMLFFKSIGFNFFFFLIFAKSFSLIVITNFLRKFSLTEGKGLSANIFFLLFLFYTGECMYLYVETIIRFTLALSIVVLSYQYILSRNFVKFTLVIIAAMFFHITAIIMLPIYFINKIRIPSSVLFCVIIGIIAFFSPVVILNVLSIFESFMPADIYSVLKYYIKEIDVDGGYNPTSIGNLIHLFIFAICLFSRRKFVESVKNGDRYFAFIVIYFIFYFITLFAGSISRIIIYLWPIFVVVFPTMLNSFKNNVIRYSLILFISLYFFSSMVKEIKTKPSFSTYTNYLDHFLRDDLIHYEDRKNTIEEELLSSPN